LKTLSPQQWKSGIAAWLGWFFDGLELHLFTLVALPFVAQLMNQPAGSPLVKEKSAWIQAAFLMGWAIGGGFFGRLGDRLGRARALSLTILTYAIFTGLSFFAQTWWQLLICRFLAAVGVGGEWAVGASLLSETWPKKWRAWIAAVLQCGVNLGILVACGAVWLITHYFGKNGAHFERYVFLIGVVPALLVFWIRKNVPEPEEWRHAKSQSDKQPGIIDLFRGKVLSTTLLTIGICALTLTAWWAFIFWHAQHLRSLPEMASWSAEEKQQVVTVVFFLVVGISILGNFFFSWLAVRLGYRRTILWSCLAFIAAMVGAYGVPRTHNELMFWLPLIGFCSGVFGLFTMYLPPLFPTLLRTTGAGFCYNIGRIAAAIGTIVFSLRLQVSDFRSTLLSIAFLFFPAVLICLFLPDLSKEEGGTK
ncbi:MAG: nanT 1, partial [Verrucomicrobiales bacterium]|nr:nanT 1 [Verrucomicrobiales bacterium]